MPPEKVQSELFNRLDHVTEVGVAEIDGPQNDGQPALPLCRSEASKGSLAPCSIGFMQHLDFNYFSVTFIALEDYVLEVLEREAFRRSIVPDGQRGRLSGHR